MKRLVFAVSLVFGFGFMCASGDTEGEKDPDVVVVPVPDGDDDDDDDGNWCCEYEDDDGDKHFALTDGAAACNNEFGDRDGRWVSDSKCTPCCCKAANDPDDRSKGNNFELTTAASCSAVGECLAADAKQCGGDDDDDDDRGGSTRPSPRPRPTPGGSVDDRKTRPGVGSGGGGTPPAGGNRGSGGGGRGGRGR
ncbi:MAG: hypothetical protein ACI8PZ_004211 [Myxococcota bacterium]